MFSDLETLVEHRAASRIAAQDASIFLPDDADPATGGAIRARLGWIDLPAEMADHVTDLAAFTRECQADGLTDIYVLGMGGSSLCAEVLRDVLGNRALGRTRLIVLDTTDERAIRDVTDALVPERSLFLVASKSGGTVEVTSLERHFWSVMSQHLGTKTDTHFVAITDPGTALANWAAESKYRRTFINNPNVGGRYSALSFFGLVPATLVGITAESVLQPGARMAAACAEDSADNPGLELGSFLGTNALAGRDKLTLLLSPSLAPLGPWIEQLVAESTGKDGHGILPVVDEPVGPIEEYGADRAFVIVHERAATDTVNMAAKLKAADHAVFEIHTSPDDLGAEFYRWEFATAVAGLMIGVNPFDEPNVKAAKESTARQLETRRTKGAFQFDPPFHREHGYARRELTAAPPAEGTPPGRYLAILDYLPRDPKRAPIIARLRQALRRRARLATTHGFGPRYLHSTGQFHKGGPNTGTFLLFTAVDASATPVPGSDYTFSVLKYAQALGDFEALADAGRAVIHYHFEDPAVDPSVELEKVVKGLL